MILRYFSGAGLVGLALLTSATAAEVPKEDASAVKACLDIEANKAKAAGQGRTRRESRAGAEACGRHRKSRPRKGKLHRRACGRLRPEGRKHVQRHAERMLFERGRRLGPTPQCRLSRRPGENGEGRGRQFAQDAARLDRLARRLLQTALSRFSGHNGGANGVLVRARFDGQASDLDGRLGRMTFGAPGAPDARRPLRETFGYGGFRPGQVEVVADPRGMRRLRGDADAPADLCSISCPLRWALRRSLSCRH
jgi:hypothetical protein